MQSRIFIIFMLFFSVFARAKDVTYVKVVAGNPVLDEVVKNFNVVRAVDGEGFVQMIAVYQQTNQYWRTRLIRTDTSGGVVWSKDYILYEDPAQIDELSSAPFSICSSTSEEGYVIAGIWTPEEVRPMEHGGFQGAFYLEVDATGNVVQLSRHAAYQVDSTDLWCFAPLKIKPAGISGYAVAGVMSDSLSEVTSGIRLGRMCLLDNNLSETKARTIRSQHASNSNIGTSTGTYYDALNNVEVIEIPGEGFHYIFSGSMTGEYRCNGYLPQNEQGSALPFIGRFDDTLGYVWHRLGWDSLKPESNHLSHMPLGGLKYDPSSGNIFVSVWVNIYDAAWNSHANFLVLDASNGTLVKSRTIETPAYWGQMHDNPFLTQIEVSNDTLLLGGYIDDDGYSPTGSPSHDELSPIVIAINYVEDTIIKGMIFPVANNNYLTTDHKCFLCYDYYAPLSHFSGASCGSVSLKRIHTPLIYSPSVFLTNFKKSHLLDVIVGPKQLDSLLLIYRPTAFTLEDSPCQELNAGLIDQYQDFGALNINIAHSNSINVIIESEQFTNTIDEEECN